MKSAIFLLTFFLYLSVNGIAQTNDLIEGSEGDTAIVNDLLKQSTEKRMSDPQQSINLALKAKEAAEKINFKIGLGYALKNIALVNLDQGKYFEALEYYRQSLKIFDEINFEPGIANLLGNIGVIYYNQNDYVKALDYYLRSLKIAEKIRDKLRVISTLNNIGTIYQSKSSTYDKALYYYLQALPICEELGRVEELGSISVNIGTVYYEKKDDQKALLYFNKALKAYKNSENIVNAYNAIGRLYLRQHKYGLALENHKKALAISKKLNSTTNMVESLIGIAKVYDEQGDVRSAIEYFKQAENPARELNNVIILEELYKFMAKSFSKASDFGNAFKYQALHTDVKDSIYNAETDKKLTTLQFDFDLQKKQGEINLLTKAQEVREVELRRQKAVKNAVLIGLVLILIIAFILYRNYKAKVRINKILDHQKEQIEHLLLNILPDEVAKELQETGQATPRNYDSVSVMFTDFKGFTTLADKMSPAELVAELNVCFMEFDNIIERNNLEKIKTIGDSYMCAGGIPTPNDEHPYDIVKASLEIQNYVIQNNQRRVANGLSPWDVRVGIHVGPVVAGVVGKKKYAYDIWGSTVNIASRMESNGEPGQVNISASTYELVKDKFKCTHRGKIYAKNVGEIDMYFIENKIQDFDDNNTYVQLSEKEGADILSVV